MDKEQYLQTERDIRVVMWYLSNSDCSHEIFIAAQRLMKIIGTVQSAMLAEMASQPERREG